MFNLYCEYFYSESEERRLEYDYCVTKNINSGIFDNIFLYVASGLIPSYLLDYESAGKVRLIYDRSLSESRDNDVFCDSPIKRTTFKDLFSLSDGFCRADDINVICNLDIWFDDSIKLLDGRLSPEIAIGLSRWYESDDHYMVAGLHMDGKAAPGSNDVWAWMGECRLKDADFCIGYTACDSKLMRSFLDHGYRVYNPAKSIRTWHRHKGRGPTPPMVDGPYWDVPLDHNTIEEVI